MVVLLLDDLKLALFYSEMGNWLKIQIKRDAKTLDKKIEIFSFAKFSYFRKEQVNEPQNCIKGCIQRIYTGSG